MSTPETAAVLFANDAFYTAFATRDMAAMRRIWSAQSTVTCIHPGWAPLIGREAVMQSWEGILGAPQAPQIECLSPQASVAGNAAYVICYERLSSGILAATNVFVREPGGWRLVHHHAGPTQAPQEETASVPPVLQ